MKVLCVCEQSTADICGPPGTMLDDEEKKDPGVVTARRPQRPCASAPYECAPTGMSKHSMECHSAYFYEIYEILAERQRRLGRGDKRKGLSGGKDSLAYSFRLSHKMQRKSESFQSMPHRGSYRESLLEVSQTKLNFWCHRGRL